MPQYASAFSIHGPTAAPARNSLLDAAVGVLIDTVIGVLVDIAFGRAMQQLFPALSIHGPTAAPASNRILDTVAGVLIDTVVGVLVDIAFGRAMQQVPAFTFHGRTAAPPSNIVINLRIALPADFHVVLLAVHFILFASLVVAAFAAIVLGLDRAGRASRGRERRLAVAPLFHLAVAVVLVILAIVSA
jgi:hypothetical protein